MRFGRTREIDDVGFDITAMNDIVLLLIIFFVLSAQFGKMMLAAVNLPNEPGSPVAASGPQQIVIDMTSEGGFKIEGVEMDLDRLTQLVASDLRRGKSLDVMVRADRQAACLHLNRLASALALVGVRDWKLATTGEGAK